MFFLIISLISPYVGLLKYNIMESKKVIDRNGKATEELYCDVEKVYKGVSVRYTECYYLDYSVDEDSGKIDKTRKEKFYSKDQVDRNLRNKRNAYMVAMGSISPEEIKEFRGKYQIAASTLSFVLGFSKNTISIIETEGVSSLSTGRYIRLCMNNKKVIHNYIRLCNNIDTSKKEELQNRI